MRSLPTHRLRRGASATEIILLICGIAIACLIAVTALGRKVNLLGRAATKSLDDGTARRAPMPDMTDLTNEFAPSFADLQAGRGGPSVRVGPLGQRLDSQADFYANPARDPRSQQTLDQIIGGNPAGNPNTVPLADFPATIVLPAGIESVNDTLLAQQHAQQLNNPAVAATEQGAVIIRRPDGTLVAVPGNNPGNAGSWNPNFNAAGPNDVVVGDIHIHPPVGQPGFLPGGFSDGDFNAGLFAQGPAQPATATQGAVSESVLIMRTGDTVYVAIRTANTVALTPAQVTSIFGTAQQDALDNGASPEEAIFAANRAVAEAGGLALYRGRAGEPVRRVH